MSSTVIAADLAKNVFEVAVSHRPGQVTERHRLSRRKFLPFFAERKPATVIMESCASSHHWGRKLQALGHSVRLLPPRQVRPYVLGNKTDRSDAKGLLEAFRNEDLKPVPVKTVVQQSLTSLHRLRSTWLATRTARLNTVRGLLREFGYTIPVGARHVVPRTWALLEDADVGIPDPLRIALAEACLEIRDLEQRVKAVEKQLSLLAKDLPVVERLLTIPGIGLLTGTALVAFVGDVQRFPTGRHFASYLGLTPREHSTGQARRLGRISKRGDVYLRMLLIQGGRAVLQGAARSKARLDHLRSWGLQVKARRGQNKTCVALANKLARIAWAIWKHERRFEPRFLAT